MIRITETKMTAFRQDYQVALQDACAADPGRYVWYPNTTKEDNGRAVREISQRFFGSLQRGGIRSIVINNSPVFKALAKKYGINNTYKAWEVYLAS